jgi:general secretion pathway protein G
MKIPCTQRGFTLVELLVVVAIISLLSSVVLASLQSARNRAQDAKRMADMKQLRIALEFYYDINKQYPADPSNTQVSSLTGSTNNIRPYINPIPTDPTYTSSSGYRYRTSNINGRQSYTMLVRLTKKNGAWCSVSVPPGHTQWINSYPPCGF